jgi:hypothetical protein
MVPYKVEVDSALSKGSPEMNDISDEKMQISVRVDDSTMCPMKLSSVALPSSPLSSALTTALGDLSILEKDWEEECTPEILRKIDEKVEKYMKEAAKRHIEEEEANLPVLTVEVLKRQNKRIRVSQG